MKKIFLILIFACTFLPNVAFAGEELSISQKKLMVCKMINLWSSMEETGNATVRLSQECITLSWKKEIGEETKKLYLISSMLSDNVQTCLRLGNEDGGMIYFLEVFDGNVWKVVYGENERKKFTERNFPDKCTIVSRMLEICDGKKGVLPAMTLSKAGIGMTFFSLESAEQFILISVNGKNVFPNILVNGENTVYGEIYKEKCWKKMEDKK